MSLKASIPQLPGKAKASRELLLSALFIAALALVLFGDIAMRAQSVAEAAQQNKAHPGPKSAKLYTDENLASSDASESNSKEEEDAQKGPTYAEKNAANAAAFRSSISDLKRRIAAVHTQIEQLRIRKLRYENNYHGTTQYTQQRYYARYKDSDARMQGEISRLQAQADDLQAKLEALQERARRAGFGNAVYDP